MLCWIGVWYCSLVLFSFVLDWIGVWCFVVLCCFVLDWTEMWQCLVLLDLI